LTKYSEDRAVCAAGGKGLLAIYTALRTPEKISSIISSYPCADVNSDEEEDVFYATAYEVYADSNYRDAIPQLEKYLKKYPTGKYASELNLFMANSFFSLGEIEQSMEVYKAFLARPTNGYTEFAAVRVSKYLYNNGQYAEALPYYKQLEKVSSEPEVIYNARLGIMRSSFLEEIWKDAAAYASRLLRDVELDPKIKMEAHYANGMSNHRLQNNTEALISLEWITKNTSTVMSAEAKFTIAEIHYKSGNYEASEKAIRELMKMKPTYNYWVAKALILQSRTAIVMNDLFQAEQTLKSVRDHYPNKEDGIILEANQLWDELMQLKNKPKPVENSGAPIIDLNQKGN
jgi:TolA-binding protein